MSRLSEREIARKLAEREDFEPPAGLLEKIKSEIPPEVSVGTAVPGERRSAMPSKQRWLIAASLVAMLGAGLFALRLREQAPALNRELAAEAPEATAAPETAAEEKESDAPQQSPQAPPPLQEEARQSAAAARALPPPPPPPPPPPLAAAKPDLEVLGDARRMRAEEVAQSTAPAEVPASVEGGVEGGVVGGVPGGVVAGESRAYDAAPLQVGGTIAQSELEKIPTARVPYDAAPLRVGGATAAPAPGQPYADVFYKSARANEFTDTAVDRLSTFGLDVDTASYTVTRRYLTDGNLPDPKSVRVEEFVNFFDYGDPPPARGDFAIRAEGAPSPFAQGKDHRLLRFNVRAREVRAENRRPAMLIFVIDVSGSMDMENRLDLVKKSLSLLLDQLRPSDQIGLVTFGTEARVLLEPTSDREAVRQAIERLNPEGSTNTEEGLLKGYEMADRNFRQNAVNRIVLCSDGVANVGRTGPRAILGQIEREARRGIELTTLGFGMGNYNDQLMEQLADKGDGRYAYIDTLDEARRVLVEELTGTLQTIAKDAKVQVEFNPAVVARYRLLGYENRAIADERFRDERVDAGEVGAGHSVTALYEIELRPGAPREQPIATLHLRYRTPEIGNVTEAVRRVGFSDLAPSWEQASPSLRLAGLVAQFAEILTQTPWGKGDLSEVARQLREVEKALPKSAKADRVSQFGDLVEKAARIKAGG
jgi:Ca-activated chloride channel family protein